MAEKILVIGYGAMAMYLVPDLSARGYQVDVYCMEQVTDQFDGVTFHQANAFEDGFLKNLLETGGYDAAVDFLMYDTEEKFRQYYKLFLDNVRHYIFLSTYRIYANEEHPVKETSPRLLEVVQDPEYQVTENEYSYSVVIGKLKIKGSPCKGKLMIYLDAASEVQKRKHPGKQVEPAGVLYYNIRKKSNL